MNFDLSPTVLVRNLLDSPSQHEFSMNLGILVVEIVLDSYVMNVMVFGKLDLFADVRKLSS